MSYPLTRKSSDGKTSDRLDFILSDQWHSRSMDLIMLTLFGARERTLSDWTAIVKQADSNLQVKYSYPPSNVLDVVWNESNQNSASASGVGSNAPSR